MEEGRTCSVIATLTISEIISYDVQWDLLNCTSLSYGNSYALNTMLLLSNVTMRLRTALASTLGYVLIIYGL